MKKTLIVPLSAVFALAFAVLPASAMAEDQTQQAFDAFEASVAPIQQQLYAKQAELDALLSGGQRDDAQVQKLFGEIGELKGRMYVAREELRSKLGGSDAPYTAFGPRHRGGYARGGPAGPGCPGYGEYRGHGGYRGHGMGGGRGGFGGHHGGHRW